MILNEIAIEMQFINEPRDQSVIINFEIKLKLLDLQIATRI